MHRTPSGHSSGFEMVEPGDRATSGEEHEEEEEVEEIEEEEVEVTEDEAPQSQQQREQQPGQEEAAQQQPSSQAPSQLPPRPPPAAAPAPAAPAAEESAPAAAAAPGGEEDASFAALRAIEAMALEKLQSAAKLLGSSQTVSEATSNLSKLAGGFTAGFTSGMSSWFAGSSEASGSSGGAAPQASSTRSAAPPLSTQQHTSAGGKGSSEVQQLFGLSDTEQLVESFKCKLLQTYACSHNSYTPAIQMAFQGTLHVTDGHVCFGVEERGKQLPIKVALRSVQAASRQLPAAKGGSDLLRLELRAGEGAAAAAGKFVVFKDFEHGGSALDSALALIEHLTAPDS